MDTNLIYYKEITELRIAYMKFIIILILDLAVREGFIKDVNFLNEFLEDIQLKNFNLHVVSC